MWTWALFGMSLAVPAASEATALGLPWSGRIFATLGRQSRVRNLSKKTIAQVNIREACHAIAQPEQPVPLRISSQFMAGLARVYVSQVCISRQVASL